MDNVENKKPTKPLILAVKDAKIELVECVNLQLKVVPAFILKNIVSEILTSLKEIELKECEMAETQYRESVEKTK